MSIGTPTFKSTTALTTSTDFGRLMQRSYVPRTTSDLDRLLKNPRVTPYTRLPAVPRSAAQNRAVAQIARRMRPSPLGVASMILGGGWGFQTTGFQTYSPPPGPANGLEFIRQDEWSSIPGVATVWGTDTGNQSTPTETWSLGTVWLRQVKIGNVADPDDWIDGWKIHHDQPVEPGEYYYRTNRVWRYRASIYTYFPRNVSVWRNNTTEVIAEPWIEPIQEQAKKQWGPESRDKPRGYRPLRNISGRRVPPRPPPPFELNTTGRPKKGVKEVKIRMTKGQYAVWNAINHVMGFLESMDLLYKAAGGPPTRDPAKQFSYLYLEGHIQDVDWLLLQELMAENNVEDAIFGGLGELSAEASRDLNRPIGFQVGLAM